MCRHTQVTDRGEVAWGYDYPLRTYFFQAFDAEGECVVWEGDFQPLSNGRLLELLDEYNVVLNPLMLAAYVSDLPCCPRGNAGPTPQMQAFQDALRKMF